MKFVSTRAGERGAPAVSFGAALTQGLAPDGGLYVPEAWPSIPVAAFNGATSLPDIAAVMLKPFVEGDAIANDVGAIVREAFDFPAPLMPVADGGKLSVLELFHGPTAAFKDFGARFLAASMERLRLSSGAQSRDPGQRPLNILVATPAAQSPRRFIGVRAWSFPYFSPRVSCRRRRSASSPAGATTCARTASTAASTIASDS